MIASYGKYAVVVDQAVSKGRITVLSDLNLWQSCWNESSKDLLMRLLTNSRENKEKVEEGEDPNEDFGKECALKGQISAMGKTWAEWSEPGDTLSSEESVDVTLTATDIKCGLQSVSYYLSEDNLSEEQLGALAEDAWQELTLTEGTGSFELKKTGKTIV